MRKSNFSDQIHLHFIVLIFGFTGILGKLISVDALHLTTIRMFLASLGLYGYYRYSLSRRRKSNKNKSASIKGKTFIKVCGVGILMAVHWFTFYHAIKISNVSVALACFSATTLFTSLIEPLVEKRKIYWIEVVLGLVIIVGLSIIFQFEFRYYQGILVGVFSAFVISIATVINRQLVQQYDHTYMSIVELAIGAVFLLLIFLLQGGTLPGLVNVAAIDWFWLIILSLVCTSYAFTAVMELMKRISAYKVNLAISLEPVYGIILALLIFGESEQMSPMFYVGAVLVFLAVFSYPFLMARFGNN